MASAAQARWQKVWRLITGASAAPGRNARPGSKALGACSGREGAEEAADSEGFLDLVELQGDLGHVVRYCAGASSDARPQARG